MIGQELVGYAQLKGSVKAVAVARERLLLKIPFNRKTTRPSAQHNEKEGSSDPHIDSI